MKRVLIVLKGAGRFFWPGVQCLRWSLPLRRRQFLLMTKGLILEDDLKEWHREFPSAGTFGNRCLQYGWKS
jgi:hypothetical protein